MCIKYIWHKIEYLEVLFPICMKYWMHISPVEFCYILATAVDVGDLSLCPVASFVLRSRGIVCVVPFIFLLSNRRTCLESFGVSLCFRLWLINPIRARKALPHSGHWWVSWAGGKAIPLDLRSPHFLWGSSILFCSRRTVPLLTLLRNRAAIRLYDHSPHSGCACINPTTWATNPVLRSYRLWRLAASQRWYNWH